MTRTILHLMTCVVLLLSTVTCAQEKNEPAPKGAASSLELLDTDPVIGLLDLLDTLVAHNPPVRETRIRLSTASQPEQERILDSLTQRNADDPQINRQIDAFLALPAYKLYYEQFRNMTPEKHRGILLNLPHRAINSPADIASTLMELLLNRDAVRAWMKEVMASVDLNHSDSVAREWIPPGDYAKPPIRFIYDGNGDAFARDGEVVFDLYSIVFAQRPTQTRFDSLAGLGAERVEGVLAHEMQHIYADRYLYPPGRTFDSWQDEWIDRITRRFVSEGVAMQCDVKESFRRQIMEDSGVVRYWIGQINEKFTALKSGTITQPDFESWYRATYQDSARVVLAAYGKRAYPDSDLRQFVAEHIIDRPTLDYTLGWWMISRIRQHDSKDKILALLSNPAEIYTLYNATVPEGNADLKVSY